MELAAFSDRGIGTRERLEDYAADRIITTPGGLQLQIAMVCDGAGGGEAGELAARLTSRTIFEYLEISPETSVPKLLIKAVEEANKAVYSELQGTGTSTVALAAVHLNDGATYGRLYIANVGNSRIYLIRDGRLVRLNIDHTLANEYVFAGQMSPEEAKELNDPNYVTRSIGTGAKISVDIGFYAERGRDFVNSRRASRIGQKGMELLEGDTVFAASDGLFPFVQDSEFIEYALDDDVERATRTLLKYAADRRPDDNTALSMLFVPSRNRKMVQVTQRFSNRQRAGIGFFIVAIILALAFMGLQVANGESQRVALLATQTFVQQIVIEASYTHTPTPLPATATATLAVVAGQVGNRFSLSQPDSIPIFAGRFIDPLSPPEINYVSIAGANVLAAGQLNNPANLYFQPLTSIRLANVIDDPAEQHLDLGLGRGADMFVNLGDYQNGGVSVALEQNPDIMFQSTSSCFAAKQISADPSKPQDTDKVALTCYGGDNTCSYQLPGEDPVLMAGSQRFLLDVNNNTLIDTGNISQEEIDLYRETIWTLTHNPDQLNCLLPWLDEDKDGINFPDDECPIQPGSVAAHGCPDEDNDGVQDSVDQCLGDPGPASNKGCPIPDVDDDGLAGNDDFCPFDAGPAETGGCPDATQYYDYLTQTAVAQPTTTGTPTVTPTPTETPVPLPEANADNYTTEGIALGTTQANMKPLIISAPGVLTNDEVNGAVLVAFTGTTTQGGSVTLNTDGGFIYTPVAGYIGFDTFSYTLNGTLGDDSATVTIEVLEPPIAPPVASFSPNPSAGPAPLQVSFIDSSTGIINSRAWNFGDGVTDTAISPSHTYTVPGTYAVSLTVSGPGGSDSAFATVTVQNPAPIACISPNPATALQGNPITFTSCSGTVSGYAWTSTGGTPQGAANGNSYTVNYPAAGTFQVCLVVTNSQGTSSTQTCAPVTITLPPLTCTITVAGSPTAAGGGTVTFGVAGCGTLLGPTTYAWTFGDGGTDNTNNPSPAHPYVNATTADLVLPVGLTITDAGRTQSPTSSVTVSAMPNPPPIACIRLNGANIPEPQAPNPIVLPIGSIARFRSCSSNAVAGSADWVVTGSAPFNNQDTLNYTFTNAGDYTVTLTVDGTDTPSTQDNVVINIQVGPTACFYAMPATTINLGQPVTFDGGCSQGGPGITYSWEFDDGSPLGNGKNVTHTYATAGTYDVVLTVTRGGVTDASPITTITVVAPPAAACFTFGPNTTIVASGQRLSFDATCSTGVVANNYAWTVTNPGGNPGGVIAGAGSQVAVTFTNTLVNPSALVTVCLTINGGPPPVAACQNFTVTLGAGVFCAAAVDDVYNITNPGTAPAAQIVDNTPGVLRNDTLAGTTTLAAVNNTNANGTVDLTNTGQLSYTPPSNIFTGVRAFNYVLTTPGCANSQGTVTINVALLQAVIVATPAAAGSPLVTFDGTTSTGAILFYDWTFGDGTTATGATPPQHDYVNNGTYRVTLTVTGPNGSNTVAQNVTVTTGVNPTVRVPPIAAIDAAIVDGSTVTFNSTSSGDINIYDWNLGDGSPHASGSNFTHTFPAIGVYDVTLIVVGPLGADVATVTVDLNATPTPTFTWVPRTATPTATLEPSQEPPQNNNTPQPPQPTPKPTRRPTVPPPPTPTEVPPPTDIPVPPPVAVNDEFSVGAGGSISVHISQVLSNDTVNGASASSIGGSSHGSIVQSPDDPNVYIYTPEAGFTGTDTATYSLTNAGGSSTATVTFNVN